MGNPDIDTWLQLGPNEHYTHNKALGNLILYIGFRRMGHTYPGLLLLVDRYKGKSKKVAPNLFGGGNQLYFYLFTCRNGRYTMVQGFWKDFYQWPAFTFGRT